MTSFLTRPFWLPVLAVVLLGGCLHRHPPALTPSPAGAAADIGPRLNNYSQATAPADGLIVVTGDGFVGPAPAASPSSRRGGGQTATTSLADALATASGLKTEDETQPGAMIAAGANRLAQGPAGNVLVICYGFGDAAANTTTAGFQGALDRMIAAAHARGAAVFVVTEPANASPLSVKAEAFRAVMRNVAAADGAGLIDTPPALTKASVVADKANRQPRVAIDIIAGTIAQYIRIAPAAG